MSGGENGDEGLTLELARFVVGHVHHIGLDPARLGLLAEHFGHTFGVTRLGAVQHGKRRSFGAGGGRTASGGGLAGLGRTPTSQVTGEPVHLVALQSLEQFVELTSLLVR